MRRRRRTGSAWHRARRRMRRNLRHLPNLLLLLVAALGNLAFMLLVNVPWGELS